MELALQSARLGETWRQHLLAAHKLCVKEAKSRWVVRGPVDAQAAFAARILGEVAR